MGGPGRKRLDSERELPPWRSQTPPRHSGYRASKTAITFPRASSWSAMKPCPASRKRNSSTESSTCLHQRDGIFTLLPHQAMSTWLGNFWADTPGTQAGDNGTLRTRHGKCSPARPRTNRTPLARWSGRYRRRPLHRRSPRVGRRDLFEQQEYRFELKAQALSAEPCPGVHRLACRG